MESDYTKLDTKKKAMVAALEKSLGIVTTACKNVGISRGTHYNWCDSKHDNYDELYTKAVDELENLALDFAETQLHQKIQGVRIHDKDGKPLYTKEPDSACLIFFLKTKGKKRGYIERVQHEEINREPIEVHIVDPNGDNKGD